MWSLQCISWAVVDVRTVDNHRVAADYTFRLAQALTRVLHTISHIRLQVDNTARNRRPYFFFNLSIHVSTIAVPEATTG